MGIFRKKLTANDLKQIDLSQNNDGIDNQFLEYISESNQADIPLITRSDSNDVRVELYLQHIELENIISNIDCTIEAGFDVDFQIGYSEDISDFIKEASRVVKIKDLPITLSENVRHYFFNNTPSFRSGELVVSYYSDDNKAREGFDLERKNFALQNRKTLLNVFLHEFKQNINEFSAEENARFLFDVMERKEFEIAHNLKDQLALMKTIESHSETSAEIKF